MPAAAPGSCSAELVVLSGLAPGSYSVGLGSSSGACCYYIPRVIVIYSRLFHIF